MLEDDTPFLVTPFHPCYIFPFLVFLLDKHPLLMLSKDD